MKKHISLLTFMLTLICSCAVSYAAQEPQQIAASARHCVPVINVSATQNSTGTNKSWISASTVDLENDMFDSALRIICKGTDVAPSTNQFRMRFDSAPQMAVGDYCYVSFYYRINGTEENEDYTVAPPKFQVAKFGMNSGAAISAQDTSVFHVWKKVSGVAQMETAVTSGSTYIQLSFLKPTDGLSPYCVEIAGVNFIYFGIPDGETDTDKDMFIASYLNDSSVSEITYNTETVDLVRYPYSFSANVHWDGTEVYEIEGKDAWGNPAQVQYSSDKLPMTATVTAYAKNYDFTNPNDELRTQYTVSLIPIKAEYTISADRAIGGWGELLQGDKLTLDVSYYNFGLENKKYIEIIQITRGKRIIELFSKKVILDGTTALENDAFETQLALEDYSGAEVKAYIIDMSGLVDVCE